MNENKNLTKPPDEQGKSWKLTIYTAGETPISKRTERNLKQLCDEFIPDQYHIDVINILEPESSAPLDILAVPTVVRDAPFPEMRVIGDLSNKKKAMDGLGFSNFFKGNIFWSSRYGNGKI